MKTIYMTILPTLLCATALCACSDNDDPVLTERDWSGTEYFAPTDEASFSTFYKPAVGFVADPMPFFDPVAGNFKIMYLQEYRPNQALTYHPFWCLETSDGVNYRSLGEVISTGTAAEQDAALGTGSTVYNDADKTYYTFYTGHAANVAVSDQIEAVMMATSTDFVNWKKDRALLITPGNNYSNTDFRDPMVVKGDDNLWHMFVSTKRGGKGTIAEFTSPDLHTWTSAGDFMNMMWDRFYECPDIFKMGDWWYLIYSEMHSALRKVQYFKGQTLAELKACTANDAGIWPDNHEGFLDSRGFYAAKTATNGTDRFIWGWCGTRAGNDNTAPIDWAGNLVAHKLVQHPDGTLTLGELPGVKAKYSAAAPLVVKETEGTVNAQGNTFQLNGIASVTFGRLPRHARISFTVIASNEWDRFGISFVRASDRDFWYSLIVNPENDMIRKINFEEEGPAGRGFLGNNDGYIFDRPADNIYNITIVTDNSVATMYVNDVANYTNRIYGMTQNPWSINSYGGNITVSDVTITQY